ncbi:MAG: TOBE domain-containing protein [Candidatus Freyarchaeota archaeon]|nr:TOBE domain-containing protein [Candidatus Jordarchaeia archaeon]
MKISARNMFSGRIVRVERDGALARVWVSVENVEEVTALVTSEAARELELKEGDKVEVVFKATEVIVAKDGG